VALYGLTHISLDDNGQILTARVRGMSPTMPSWMGRAVDMEASGVAALINKTNKVVAIFDTTEDRPREAGGTFRPVTVDGRVLLELSEQSPGRALQDLPRIEGPLPELSRN
jgi:hypothetical protein